MKAAAAPHPPFTTERRASLAAWGEARLLGAIRGWLGASAPPAPRGMGDDCAVVPRPGPTLLITTDPVVYGGHFDAGTPPAAVGEKLLKRNLSDIAAMGGRPTAAVLALATSATLRTRWLRQFYLGLARAARRYRVPIVGGDIAQVPRGFVATLTLLGTAGQGRVATRQGGRAGDWVYVTGELGAALASGHHLTFVPRLAEGAWLAARAEVRALLDLSDGLAKDVWSLTPAGLEPALEAACVPTRPGATLRAALADGEDYELCALVDRRADRGRLERAWRRRFPGLKFTCLGRLVPRGTRPRGALDLRAYRGFEHLR